MKKNIINRLALLVLFVSGLLLPQMIGWMRVGYSAKSQYLSELGEIGAPYAPLINYGSHLPIALAVLILVAGLYTKLPKTPITRIGISLLFAIAIGYFGAFLFHCDPGCPTSGSGRQALHNLSGLIEYAGAISGLFLIFLGLRGSAPRFSAFTLLIVFTVLIGFVMMANPEMQANKGAWQRLSETAILIWFAATVFCLASAKSKPQP